MHSFAHSFIYSFIQQQVKEHQLCDSHCAWCRGHSSEHEGLDSTAHISCVSICKLAFLLSFYIWYIVGTQIFVE